jgi:flagellar biosynthesis/type III secretory pathway M-ring protein FliF/YscJ
MVIVTNNWRLWALGLVSSLVIFLIVYFAVIKPSENTANQALRQGLQQTQQAIKQSQKAFAGNKSAQQTLSNAQKLTACVAAAGTDPSKLTACQSKFGH